MHVKLPEALDGEGLNGRLQMNVIHAVMHVKLPEALDGEGLNGKCSRLMVTVYIHSLFSKCMWSTL